MTRGRPNPLHSRITERLKQARRAIGETRMGLGLGAGRSRGAVQGIEYEGYMPGIDLVEEISRALGTSPGWLAYGQGEAGGVQDLPGAATLGERLRTAREQAGLSIRELGRRTEITYTSIQNAERGAMPSIARVEALADALDVSPAWLAFGEGPQHVKRRRARR